MRLVFGGAYFWVIFIVIAGNYYINGYYWTLMVAMVLVLSLLASIVSDINTYVNFMVKDNEKQ